VHARPRRQRRLGDRPYAAPSRGQRREPVRQDLKRHAAAVVEHRLGPARPERPEHSACANPTVRTDVDDDVEVITVRRSYNNAHAVRLPEGTLLVDAGLERDAQALADDLRAAGVDPADLALVVLTHGHADHAGGAAWLRDTYGVPVLAGAGDLDLLEAGHNDPLCPTDATARQRADAAQAETFTPFLPDHRVDAAFDLAGLGLRGVVTPVAAHTEGSLVLEVGGALFVGDLLRGSVVGRRAVTHYFQCDPERAKADAAALLDASAASWWFVGHFGPVSREEVAGFLAGGSGAPVQRRDVGVPPPYRRSEANEHAGSMRTRWQQRTPFDSGYGDDAPSSAPFATTPHSP
jgi:hydroxyacylglutathione hydrolase